MPAQSVKKETNKRKRSGGSSAKKKKKDTGDYGDGTNLDRYSLDDLRRLTRKLLALDVIKPDHIAKFVEDEPKDVADRVLCMYDEKLKWNLYNIRNEDFNLPDFMRNPVYLARGGFGTVIKCFRYREPVAVKKVDVPDARHWEMALRLLRELVVMKQAKKMNQRHICKIIDIFGDPSVKNAEDMKSIFIVMPLYKPGALEGVKVDTPSMFKTIAGHTLSALHFLHIHKIMHRDIKKENIFFDGKKNRAYLADLGQARTLVPGKMSGRGEVGTRCYLSPEILQGNDYEYKSDVYSLGQAWYESLCMEGDDSLYPYKRSGGQEHIDMQRAMDPIQFKSGEKSGAFASWAVERWKALEDVKNSWKEEAVVNIIEHTLMFDPKNRFDTKQLFQLPYFFPFISQERVMDLREVETNDYKEIKQRIFDLQHGSCLRENTVHASSGKPAVKKDRKSQLQKMCSMAVQYFDGHVNQSAVPMECSDDE